jgi:hypothetical protein
LAAGPPGVLVLVALLVGAALGVGIDRVAVQRRRPAPPPPAPQAAGIAKSLANRPRRAFSESTAAALGLSEAQMARADSLMALQQQRTQALMREMQPRMVAIRAESDSAIKALLTPEQQRLWEERKAKRRAAAAAKLKPAGADSGERE